MPRNYVRIFSATKESSLQGKIDEFAADNSVEIISASCSVSQTVNLKDSSAPIFYNLYCVSIIYSLRVITKNFPPCVIDDDVFGTQTGMPLKSNQMKGPVPLQTITELLAAKTRPPEDIRDFTHLDVYRLKSKTQ